MAGKGKGSKGKRNKESARALTAQGVGFEPKEYEAGETAFDEFYRFSLLQLNFLEEYAKDLDANRAARAAGYKKPHDTARTLLNNPAIRREIEAIHDCWRYNIRMTAEHASARHIRLMDKVEDEFDKAEEAGDKAKFATSLMRGSDTYMRAAGHFNHGGGGNDTQVVINIDLGDERGVVIDGEKVE